MTSSQTVPLPPNMHTYTKNILQSPWRQCAGVHSIDSHILSKYLVNAAVLTPTASAVRRGNNGDAKGARLTTATSAFVC